MDIHLRGRVTAVGRQLEVLFTTHQRHSQAQNRRRAADGGVGSR
jgi:hypothetical protein